jgi:AcrR family transcriptional regulator
MTEKSQTVISFDTAPERQVRVLPSGPMRPASRPARADTAQAILDAALDAFSRYGFRRASVDDVARAAGVAKGTVYLHFESKEALFRAVASRLADDILARAAAARGRKVPAPRKLEAVLAAKFLTLFDLVFSSPHAAEILESGSRLSGDVFADADRKYEAHVAAVLGEGVRSGEIALKRSGLSAPAAAALLVLMARGLDATDARGARPSRETYARRLSAFVRAVLAGFGAR